MVCRGERCPYGDGEGEAGSFWGEGLDQAAFRSVVGIPQMTLLWVVMLLNTGASHVGFLAPAQGAAEMPYVSFWVISARGRTVALKPIRSLVMPCWFRAISVCWSARGSKGWLLCGARGGLLERAGEVQMVSPAPSRHPSEAPLRAGQGAALEMPRLKRRRDVPFVHRGEVSWEVTVVKCVS